MKEIQYLANTILDNDYCFHSTNDMISMILKQHNIQTIGDLCSLSQQEFYHLFQEYTYFNHHHPSAKVRIDLLRIKLFIQKLHSYGFSFADEPVYEIEKDDIRYTLQTKIFQSYCFLDNVSPWIKKLLKRQHILTIYELKQYSPQDLYTLLIGTYQNYAFPRRFIITKEMVDELIDLISETSISSEKCKKYNNR